MSITKMLSRAVAVSLVASAITLTGIACGGGGGGGGGGGKLSGTYGLDDYPGMTRTFSGGKCKYEGPGSSREGTYTISGDELTVTLEGDVTVFKFKIDGNKLLLANAAAVPSDLKNWQSLTKK
jgi:hypothetical protein